MMKGSSLITGIMESQDLEHLENRSIHQRCHQFKALWKTACKLLESETLMAFKRSFPSSTIHIMPHVFRGYSNKTPWFCGVFSSAFAISRRLGHSEDCIRITPPEFFKSKIDRWYWWKWFPAVILMSNEVVQVSKHVASSLSHFQVPGQPCCGMGSS